MDSERLNVLGQNGLDQTDESKLFNLVGANPP